VGWLSQSKLNLVLKVYRAKTSLLQLIDIRHTRWGIETNLHYRRDVTSKKMLLA
jgi:hypothetical protein